MRVTHIITRLIVGGAQENTIASVRGLRQRHKASVRLISGPTSGPEGSLEDVAASGPGTLTIVPPLVRPVHPWKDLLAYRSLVGLLRYEHPDIVHTHSGKAGILGRFAARRAGVPVIIHTIHGPSFGPFQGAVANTVFRSAERAAARVTTHFVTVAGAMTRQYLAAGIGLPDQFTRIFSGFDLAPFLAARNDLEIRARYGIGPEDFVIGKIARLFKLKGHDDLLAAATSIIKAVPHARFLLVGGGEWRRRFENLVAGLGLSRHFVFAGLVPPADVPSLIGIMDLLVHLSRREGLARALPQALAAGKPVIAYDLDGANEVCLDQETGFLVEPGNRHQFSARVIELARDAELRSRFGRNGQALARQCFSVEKMVDDLHALYTRLLARVSKARIGAAGVTRQ